MKNLSLLLGLLFLFIGNISLSAQSINGFLKDKETNAPIPYANISSSGTYGVITNNEGEFIIQTQYLTEQDTLTFSSLGYKSLKLAINELGEKTLYLQPTSFQLGEVFLTNKELSAEEIIAKALETAPENYVNGPLKYSIFKREHQGLQNDQSTIDFKKINFLSKDQRKAFNQELEKMMAKTKEMNNSYQDIYFHLYHFDKDYKLEPVLATKLADPNKDNSTDKILQEAGKIIRERLESANSFKVKSGLFTLQDSLDFDISRSSDSISIKYSKNELSKIIERYDFGKKIGLDFLTDTKNFNYTVEGVTGIDDEFVYEISFEPRKDKFKYKGSLFISAESFAILKVHYELVTAQKSPGILKTTFGIQNIVNVGKETAAFEKNASGKYVLKYVHRYEDQQNYLNRNLKFIENTSAKDGVVLKAKFMVQQRLVQDRHYLMVSSEKIGSGTFEKVKEEEKVPLKVIRQYDANIWKNYNIISPEKEMRNFQ